MSKWIRAEAVAGLPRELAARFTMGDGTVHEKYVVDADALDALLDGAQEVPALNALRDALQVAREELRFLWIALHEGDPKGEVRLRVKDAITHIDAALAGNKDAFREVHRLDDIESEHQGEVAERRIKS